MISHKRIWSAIDKIAKEEGLTPSGLAKKAGLDPTSFNKSKRIGSGGKLRWPSTESLYKILKFLGKDLSHFSSLVEPDSFSEIKVIGSMQGNMKGFCESENEWGKINFPRSFNKDYVAIKVKGYSLEPIFRNEDVLIVDPKNHFIEEEDRVVIKTKKEELLIKKFYKKNEDKITVKSLDDKEVKELNVEDVDWVARIMWVSQ